MENRDKIIAEYFELIVLLNKANPTSNQRTEIDFRIDKRNFRTLRLITYLQGTGQNVFLELCHKDRNQRWESSDFTSLTHLERYCANFLQKEMSNDMASVEISSLIVELKRELRSLGITR